MKDARSPGKEPFGTSTEIGWPQNRSTGFGEEVILFHLSIETLLFGRPVRRLVIIVTVILA